jgi:predicted nucleic acid-binding protein
LSVYADSSFLVSPYVQDAHKAEFLRRIAKRPAIWLTPFQKAEVASALSLHVFYQKLTPDAARRAWQEFQEDISAGVWVRTELPPGAWDSCIDLSRRFSPTLGARTVDSLHVACALALKSRKFWTFDERQAKLAMAVGLDTSP